MILSAPVPVGGYIRTLENDIETDCYIAHIELTLHRVLNEPVVEVGAKSSKTGLWTLQSDDEPQMDRWKVC